MVIWEFRASKVVYVGVGGGGKGGGLSIIVIASLDCKSSRDGDVGGVSKGTVMHGAALDAIGLRRKGRVGMKGAWVSTVFVCSADNGHDSGSTVWLFGDGGLGNADSEMSDGDRGIWLAFDVGGCTDCTIDLKPFEGCLSRPSFLS